MRTILIACETIKTEILSALELTDTADLDIIWIESGLHNAPKKLGAVLQDKLDGLVEVDYVLMGFGFCGNALLGLKTHEFKMVIPKVDDCISLLLGSCPLRKELTENHAAYFITEGWLSNESNLYDDYRYAIEQYGQETADDVYETIFAHYRTLCVIDTGLSDYDTFLGETTEMAQALGLQQMPVPGTIKYLKQLLTGPWSVDHFLTIPAHTSIDAGMLKTSEVPLI